MLAGKVFTSTVLLFTLRVASQGGFYQGGIYPGCINLCLDRQSQNIFGATCPSEPNPDGSPSAWRNMNIDLNGCIGIENKNLIWKNK